MTSRTIRGECRLAHPRDPPRTTQHKQHCLRRRACAAALPPPPPYCAPRLPRLRPCAPAFSCLPPPPQAARNAATARAPATCAPAGGGCFAACARARALLRAEHTHTRARARCPPPCARLPARAAPAPHRKQHLERLWPTDTHAFSHRLAPWQVFFACRNTLWRLHHGQAVATASCNLGHNARPPPCLAQPASLVHAQPAWPWRLAQQLPWQPWLLGMPL